MRASLTQREYLGWRKYWAAEPWGPWRDNLHAAMIARELRRPQAKRGARVTIEEFMVRDPAERVRSGNRNLLTWLRSVARKVPK
jgi:hypothetical protein